jgi:hypothetical protein
MIPFALIIGFVSPGFCAPSSFAIPGLTPQRGASIAYSGEMLNRNQPTSSQESFSKPFLARAAAAAAGLGFFGLFLVAIGLRCPLAEFFHVPCPACGSTRAVRALLHRDLASAVHFNPVAPLVFGLIGLIAARGIFLLAREGSTQRLSAGRFGRFVFTGLFVAVSLEIVVWALRFFGLFGGPVAV